MTLPEGTLLQGGKYRIVRFISSGGFGCTYEAVHVMLHKRVAIKEFFVKNFCHRDEKNFEISVALRDQQALIDKIKKKFVDEAIALNQFDHANIVKVSDIFEEHGTAYYVMDYIEGVSLQDMIRPDKKLPEQKALKYISQIAEALSYVHSKNRLHLDIKPGNILVDKNTDTAVLIDFGASKQYDEESGENTSTLLGLQTKGYSPLEQLNTSFTSFSPATDIYALGATLYRLISGVVPPDATIIASDESALIPLPNSISANTREAVAKAMQLKRNDRPQSIEQFLSLLGKQGGENAVPSNTSEDTLLEESDPYELDLSDGTSEIIAYQRKYASVIAKQSGLTDSDVRMLENAVKTYETLSGTSQTALKGLADVLRQRLQNVHADRTATSKAEQFNAEHFYIISKSLADTSYTDIPLLELALSAFSAMTTLAQEKVGMAVKHGLEQKINKANDDKIRQEETDFIESFKSKYQDALNINESNVKVEDKACLKNAINAIEQYSSNEQRLLEPFATKLQELYQDAEILDVLRLCVQYSEKPVEEFTADDYNMLKKLIENYKSKDANELLKSRYNMVSRELKFKMETQMDMLDSMFAEVRRNEAWNTLNKETHGFINQYDNLTKMSSVELADSDLEILNKAINRYEELCSQYKGEHSRYLEKFGNLLIAKKQIIENRIAEREEQKQLEQDKSFMGKLKRFFR